MERDGGGAWPGRTQIPLTGPHADTVESLMLASGKTTLLFAFLVMVTGLASACRRPLNNPYGRFEESASQGPGIRRVHFMAGEDEPKTLDPVRANDSVSFSILSNIVSTAYEYDYLDRPIRLKPLLARDLPEEGIMQWQGRPVNYFRFRVRPGLRYADDACFPGGRGREVRAEDIIYTLKRTADRSLNPYAFPLLERIAGFTAYADAMEKLPPGPGRYEADIPGVRKWHDDGVEILLTETDLQLKYFFAMASSAPWPEDCFRSWTASGRSTDRGVPASGAFHLKEWKPQIRIVLERNPGFTGFQRYRFDGHTEEEELPLLDEVRITMVKAAPTYWRLFRQGYVDRMSVGRDTFNQVFDGQQLSDRFRRRGIRVDQESELATYGWTFNMEDPQLGGNVWLRRAIACSIDVPEMLDRFQKNRSIRAVSLVPPGMEGGPSGAGDALFADPTAAYGCKEGVPSLLSRAGYPGGIDPQTGHALKLHLLDAARSGGSGLYRFYAESAQKNGWDLTIDIYDLPTVFEKRMKHEFQITFWGWSADYPDAQNFYQLFYGPNAKTTLNESSYRNAEFDALYRQILVMRPSRQREEILHRMDALLKRDVPVVLFHHPVQFSISWPWLDRVVPHPVDFNMLKYRRVDGARRSVVVEDLNPVFGEGF